MAGKFYQELGVSRTATAAEIRDAYKKLAVKYHPDRNPDNAAAEAKFKAVNQAHTVLSDKQKRKLYDEFGEHGLREGFNADGMRGRSPFGGNGGGLEDIFQGGGAGGFGDLFGDVFRRGGRPARAQDTIAVARVDFASVIRGTQVSVRVPGTAGEVTVRIPVGAGTGDKLRVAGKGASSGPGGPVGDLVIEVQVYPHSHFERDGLDLKLELPITVSEAYFGSKVRVPTVDGEVNLTVPAGTQSGQTVRLKGKGVKRKSKVGDLYVRFLVRLPKEQSKRIEGAAKVLGDLTDVSERDHIQL